MTSRRIRWPLIAAGLIVIIALDGLQAEFFDPSLKPQTLAPIAPSSVTANYAWPSYGEAAVGLLGHGLIASNGVNTPMPTASVAKVVTALCVLSKYPIVNPSSSPVITLGTNDVNLYQMYHAENGSTVQVQAGEAITEYQALQAMLLPSANNMADSLADWAFGSQTAYVAYANNYVERLGLKNTHITGSSGFDPGTVSTASDLIRLGAAALTSPILASIASQTSANVPVNGLVHNVNFALGTDGTIGIKTGNIDQDPGVYLFASKDQINSKQSAILVGAIMGGPTLTKVINDSIPLINSLKADFSSSPLLRSGQIVGEYQLPWNRQIVPAVAEDNLFPVIWKAIPVKLNLVLSKERSPIPQGTMVGVATSIGVTGLKVSTSIVLSKPIAKPPIAWRLLHPFGLGL